MPAFSNVFKTLALSCLLFSWLFSSTEAQAIPVFAKQTKQPCHSCHYIHPPTLNEFGRSFKANGYSIPGFAMDGELDTALMTKVLFERGDSGHKHDYPVSFAVYLAGKPNDRSGFLAEIPYESGSSYNDPNLKWSYVKNIASANAGVHLFTTGMVGPAYGYELMSTGAMGMNVALPGQNAMGALGLHMGHGATLMSRMSSQSVLAPSLIAQGVSPTIANELTSNSMRMGGVATGAGLSLQNSEGFIYYAPWYGGQQVDEVTRYANYLRMAWTPIKAGWSFGVGVQLYRGDYQYVDNQLDVAYTTNASALDIQAHGNVAGKPLGIYVTHAQAPKSESMADMNVFNMALDADNSAVGVLAELGLTKVMSLQLGYVAADYGTTIMESVEATDLNVDGDTADMFAVRYDAGAVTVGVGYLFPPTTRLIVKYSAYGGDLDGSLGELRLMALF